jgi:hypothetical protein
MPPIVFAIVDSWMRTLAVLFLFGLAVKMARQLLHI